jgi:hypothetical protein
MKKLLRYFLYFLPLTSCVNGPAGKLPALIVDHEGWGGDFTLHIAHVVELSPEKTLYTLVSDYSGKPVGFTLLMIDPMVKKPFVSSGITIRTLKDTSNNFLAALADIYGLRRPTTPFADSIIITYANLSAMIDTKKPDNWATAQLKLFMGDGSIELYMNIDRKSGTISFPEKDSSNRQDILKILSGQATTDSTK